MAPEGSPVVHVVPASYGANPDPALAILAASPQVELFDEALWCVPKQFFSPLVMDDPTGPDGGGVAGAVAAAASAGALPVVIAPDLRDLAGITRAAGAGRIIHFGASPQIGPGGAVRRALDDGADVTAMGLRSLTAGEASYLDGGVRGYLGAFQRQGSTEAGAPVPSGEGAYVLALEADVLDPALMPSVARPVPGGMMWPTLIEALGRVFENGRPAAVLLAGLRPVEGAHAPDFLLAKLLYKILSLVFAAPRQMSPRPPVS